MAYNTKQRQALIDWLTAHSEKSFTIDELADTLIENEAQHPGKSTVYRLVDKLVEDGTVKRFVKGNSRHFYYQLAGNDCSHHLHMKCTTCGTLLHMSHEETEKILATIYGENNFSVDNINTTIFGTCKECAAKR